MPVGISFENSSLKASFSLSSLPATETTPDKGVKPRLYNSLTKNRVKATAVRRSWGSTASDHREEFWSVLQANYNYIMDNQLIDKCQEVDNDLSCHTGTWTLKEFYSQFSELYSWLNSVQETIYGKEENITDKALRVRCVNTVLDKCSSLKLFNEQASQLVQLYPEVQEEVSWRATHLNSKWDSILSILGPSDCDLCDQDSCIDIDHELKCLRQWFKVMESRLEPLDFRAKYTKTEIETKALELNVLHRDIENHGKIVSSVVKLCKRTDTKCNTINARRIANGLERRWHLLFLRSLEWQCYLESLSKKQNLRNSSSDDSDSDCYREPATKYPRLSGKERNRHNNNTHHNQQHQFEEDYSSSEDEWGHLTEYGMTDTGCKEFVKDNGIDVVDGHFKTIGHTSEFTKSDKVAPNLATYYFRHEDTDSDMEKMQQQNCEAAKTTTDTQSTLEETSEEEWTYTKNEESKTPPTTLAEMKEHRRIEDIQESRCIPKSIPEETIRRLVQKAEELVSPDKTRRNSLNKLTRLNKWLAMERPDDSCDASGEDDEKESQASEDMDASITTLREGEISNSRDASFDSGSRTWCGSCISRLDEVSNSTVINNFSISESALHRITLTPKVIERLSVSVSSNNFNTNSNNSTSSTVEEVSPLVTETISPIRRKKSKLKKKSLFGKSDTHLLQSPNAQKLHRIPLIKSDSFSGYSSRFIHDKYAPGHPPTTQIHHGIFCETSTTSGADSDEDTMKRLPLFKYGQKTRYLAASELRDNSPGKSSLNTNEEQSSSLSEAWDNYQENYLSEAYSESHDSDAARKLLNFGEDYRNFIDSQSDWSAFSDMSPTFKRKKWVMQNHNEEDSNSDEEKESIRHLMKESREQLSYAEEVYTQIKLGIRNHVITGEVDELVSTCDRYINLLNHMKQSPQDCKMSVGDKAVATGLMNQWVGLRLKSLKMQEYRKLQKQILEMKVFITSVTSPDKRRILPQNYPMEDIHNEIDVCNKLMRMIQINDIPQNVQDVKNGIRLEIRKEMIHNVQEECGRRFRQKLLETIKNHGIKLATLNADVHRFTLEFQDNEDFAGCSLKSDISELYELFETTRTCTTDKLCQMEKLLPSWKTLETRLEQLQHDLKEDEKTILLIDSCLANGTFTDQTASSVRDVAKVLSETTSRQGYHSLQEIFTEGSFSDSGISDEGSEHEIGERQGRLAAIRRLVRQLEVSLSPDSRARLMMREKLNAAEEELKALQQKCRNLIARTAASTGAAIERTTQPPQPQKEEIQVMEVKTKEDGGDGDPADDPSSQTWFKRMFKASLAFQIVILTFVCLSALFEPQCCDFMNNYSWSFSPKLHYDGRPPI